MQFSPGAKLDGYEFIGLLGRGGMGEVYRARDSQLQREVAIKVLPAAVVQDPDRLRRFQEEAKATAALNHPNIIAIYQFGSFEGAPYLVTELLEGETLRHVLERGPVPTRKAIDYGSQIARGLTAAHEKGIVHRDLKPENVFLTNDGRIKILDFGLAKLIQPLRDADGASPTIAVLTDPGMMMGTVGYMAPEQVRGAKVDHRADIFAFGALFYEMLAGHRAFDRPSGIETMHAILHDDPPPVSQSGGNISPGLQKVVDRCLQKNPEQRFQSASDMAFALEAVTETGSQGVFPINSQVSRPPRRRLLWPVVGLLVLAAAALTIYFAGSRSSSTSLRVTDITQITHSGNPVYLVGTDGARLYLALPRFAVGEVATVGGDISTVPVGLPNPFLFDVSPDGSKFLVGSTKSGFSASTPLWTVNILGGAHQFLATGMDAAWSPDGRLVAYTTEDGKLCLVQSDGSGAHTLASVGGRALSPSWSPDGKLIRFAKADGLWEITATGTNLHRVVPDATGEICCGHWSPDGAFYYFDSGNQILARDERRLFFRRQAPTVQLTSAPMEWSSPVMSKDGKKLFAQGEIRRGELMRLDPQSQLFQPYLAGMSADSVSFSRDRQYVAYVSYPECILWRARADGSDRVQLSSPPLCPWLPSWSPDGSQISFGDSSDSGNQQTYIVASEGGNPRKLIPEDTGKETDATWSPSGNRIAFSTSTGGGKDPQSVLKIFDVDTKQLATIPGSAGMFAPRWSPDGRLISAIASDSTALNVFDVTTQKWSVAYKGLAEYTVWSSDSRKIYFMKLEEDPAVFRVGVADGAVETVVDLKAYKITGNSGSWMGLDPNDAPLVLFNQGTHDIYALSLERR